MSIILKWHSSDEIVVVYAMSIILKSRHGHAVYVKIKLLDESAQLHV